MQKANEWLLDNGFIQEITRGRRSTENNIRLHEAYESGVRFSDWEPKESTDSKGNYKTVNATPVQNGSKEIADIVLRYDKREWQATAIVNGKSVDVGMAEICTNCQTLSAGATVASLTVHHCHAPSVRTCPGALGIETPVTIEPRTRPLGKVY